MSVNEIERKRDLYLQAYYLQSKELLNDLEKKLEGIKESKGSQAETPEQEVLRG